MAPTILTLFMLIASGSFWCYFLWKYTRGELELLTPKITPLSLVSDLVTFFLVFVPIHCSHGVPCRALRGIPVALRLVRARGASWDLWDCGLGVRSVFLVSRVLCARGAGADAGGG